MKLARLRLRNFRCYKDETAFEFDSMTVFIGKNDVGKSTVMDALDIFLNDGAPDKNDASKAGDGKDLTIICEFTDVPLQAVIDEDVPTTLNVERLLNAAGRLEIHKTYSGHTATPKCTSISAFAVHPTAVGAADLLQLKNADLKKRAKELKADVADIDQKVNAQLRERIRVAVGDLDLKPVLVPLNDDNAKKAWDGIKAFVPILALFKADRMSSDQDSEAQEPLKIAVKEAIKQREAELKGIVAHVETEVRRIAQKTLEKLREMDPSLAQELNPQFTSPKWESLFKATFTGDDDIPVDKRGSGVRRLILLSFLRAKAEQNSEALNNATVIYAIEEPETSQHPHNQRLLVSALLDLSIGNQVILTTHTPMLARTVPDRYLRYVHLREDRVREIMHGGPDTNSLCARTLGVLPDNAIKLFIGVEGPNDIKFLKGLGKVLRTGGVDVLDLEQMDLDGELVFFLFGGSSLALWTSRLEPLARPEFHLYDRDTTPPLGAKYQPYADEVNGRDRCRAVITGKRESENYLHFEAINEAYAVDGITIGLTANGGDFDDIPELVAERVHMASGSATAWAELDPQVRSSKAGRAKARLNSAAVGRMTKARLDEVDTTGEVLAWFIEMGRLSRLQE